MKVSTMRISTSRGHQIENILMKVFRFSCGINCHYGKSTIVAKQIFRHNFRSGQFIIGGQNRDPNVIWFRAYSRFIIAENSFAVNFVYDIIDPYQKKLLTCE